jgi:protein-tyrosine phosphatase
MMGIYQHRLSSEKPLPGPAGEDAHQDQESNRATNPVELRSPHILMVCTANICRSPVAEALLRCQLVAGGLGDWQVSSAGTWAEQGRPASRYSTLLMAEHGQDLNQHRSRVVTGTLLDEVDLVLCMESGHAEALRAEFPHYAQKIYLLSQMSGRNYSISDPYGGSLDEYRQMVRDISAALDAGLVRIIELVEKGRAA